MPRLTAPDVPADLAAGLAAIREELDVPGDFPPGAVREAEDAARAPLPQRDDRRGLELFTIDPPGSMDLDQAMALSRSGDGYRIDYAIADVAAFVQPGGALDAEAHRRVVTRYLPDGNAPLHPRVLSEGAASLLPGVDRLAVVWSFSLEPDGTWQLLGLERALVRSRERFAYPSAPAADERMRLLAEIGALLQERERARGAINLPIPEQEVVIRDGGYALAYRGPLPIEEANAQISLMTGMAAARLMLERERGLLRTLPPADAKQLARLRRVAEALGVEWREPVGDLIRALDPLLPRHAALLEEAATLLRGAGYAAFDGAPPEGAGHAGVGASYAHVTAPLRRLADRYVLDLLVALDAGEAPSAADVETLERLPETMAAADRRAARVERASVDAAEARTLADRVGETFDAVVVDVDDRGAAIQIAEPPVAGRLRAEPAPALGTRVNVRLEAAEPRAREIRFVPA
jgi:VacB/RNase II family 3'-5' exoribonuclease